MSLLAPPCTLQPRAACSQVALRRFYQADLDSFDSDHMDRHPQPYAREADFAVSSVTGRSIETGRCAAGKKEVSP